MTAATPTTKEFFKTKIKVDLITGCWVWQEYKNSKGYGRMRWNKKKKMAHVVAYELYNGEIPAGMELDHKCKQRSCCNPDHLEVVSHEENMKRTRIKYCKYGHERLEGLKTRNCLVCYRLRYPNTVKYAAKEVSLIEWGRADGLVYIVPDDVDIIWEWAEDV